MEHKRKASGPGAMKSRNSHWLEVSEVHYTSSPKLKADSLEGRGLSPDIKLSLIHI